MNCSSRGSRDDRYKMFDTAKTTAALAVPTGSGQAQRSNGMHAQETTRTVKEQNKEGLDSQCGLHAQYVLQLLQLQRQAGFLCDITIHVKDKSFKAHKPLLAACSLYFRALFADVGTKELTALSLTSLTPTGFEVLLDYIYSGSLAITAENSSEVLSAATCLQMTNVVETCLNFMRSSFRMTKHVEPPLLNRINASESSRIFQSTESLLDKAKKQNPPNNTVSAPFLNATASPQ